MGRKRRLALLALLGAAIVPGTWLRTAPKPPDKRPILEMRELAVEQASVGQLTVEGLWHLTSPNSLFGGYSGLVALSADELLAVSDQGSWLRFSTSGQARSPQFGELNRRRLGDKRQVDAEAATYDPVGGQLWIAYEGSNTIERGPLSMDKVQSIEPEEMSRWWSNSGPEAMARLPDGRFLVLGEGSPDLVDEGFPGLLFDRDPVDGEEAVAFAFIAPDGYRATDMAALADGRVLILLRGIEGFVPPQFSAKLVLAHATDIAAGKAWSGEEIATLGGAVPADNFEGLAAIPDRDGGFTLWLISDDNGAALQRTLLYRLHWDPQPSAER